MGCLPAVESYAIFLREGVAGTSPETGSGESTMTGHPRERNEQFSTNRRSVLKASALGVGAMGVAGLSGVGAAASRQGKGPKSVLEIVGTHDEEADVHSFELSKSEIPSGWSTLKFENETDETHFVYLVKVPAAESKLAGFEGESLREQYMNAVTFPFQEAWDPYYVGDHNVGTFFANLFEDLPGWFFTDVTPVGGPGLTAAGKTAETTVNLEPGTYFLECYVLDAKGVFHSANGMLESLVVSEEASKMAEPEPSLSVSISTDDGIEFDPGDLSPGRHTLGVTFDDSMVYGNGLRHDVHLIRFEHDTTEADVNHWVDYLDVGADGYYADEGALTSTRDSPGPETFIGGVQDIAPGQGANNTAYVEATLRPGEYALVSEVPNPDGYDMLETFTVTPPGRS